MKKILVWVSATLFLFAYALCGFCQNPTQEEAAAYFKNNLTNLDPIEGYWNIEIIARGWNNYRRFPDEKLSENSCVIMKKGTRYNVYPTESYITKVGANQYCYHYVAYRYGNREMSTRNFTLSDIMAFSVAINLPLPADAVGSGGQHIINSNKLYPTEEVYRQIIEEQSKPTDWSGTGFALNNGYIITNHHVIDGAKSIWVFGINGNATSGYAARIIAFDRVNDLAIIRIADSRFSGFGTIPYAIKNQIADVGEDVWVLGYPLTQVLGSEIKLTNGVVSSRSGYQGDVSTYQISAPVQPGNSGGPLFDSYGNVVGIVNAGVPGAENVGYAIKTSYLQNLTDSYALSYSLPKSNTIASLALKDQVKRVKDFVFLLICSSKEDSKWSSTVSTAQSSSTTSSVSGNVGTSSSGSTSSYGTTKSSSSSPIPLTPSGKSAKMVDLGLSVKWADRNIGANSPEGYGVYFAWGETETKKEYTWENYKFYVSGDHFSNVVLSKYNYLEPRGAVDGKMRLDLSDDAAHINWGGGWRMPTREEMDELYYNCEWTRTTRNGVVGYVVKSKINGNSIFMPCAGYKMDNNINGRGKEGSYFTSTLHERMPEDCYDIYLSIGGSVQWCMPSSRMLGRVIRPVLDPNSDIQSNNESFPNSPFIF